MNFEFATATRILFGCGTAKSIGVAASAWGRRAFVLTGSRPERSQPLLRELENHHVMHTEFRVDREPTTNLVLTAVGQARAADCDLVIGIGGGSVMDAGKVVAAMLTNSGDLMQYLEVIGAGRPLGRMPAPFIAVPTTAGTGAEVTRNAVLESPVHRVKVSMRSPFMLPRLAVVDPELTYSMPPPLTAATGLDALTQLLEAFVSRSANPLTDAICREGLRHAARSLSAAFRNGGDRQAREDMCVASLFGGLALANAKLGAVHGIAGPFGGMFKAPHGAVCGRLMPFVTAANINAIKRRTSGPQAIARYREAAAIITGHPDAAAEEGAAWLKSLCKELNVPALAAYGFSKEDFPDLIAKSMRSSSMRGNPIELTEADLHAILSQGMLVDLD
jgi:alcohol dehydrogenase class IV